MRDRLFLIRQGVWALLLSMLLAGGLSSARADSFMDRAEVQQFIETMVARHGFDAEALSLLFAQARPCLSAARTMTDQAVHPLPWPRYRSHFVNAWNIRHGVRFWRRHAAVLARARQAYGVPEEVIVAIIGVETRYGKTRPRFPEFDTLATLAFDYPRRAEFFRAELEQYLLLMREEHRDPRSAKGSFAGAMGIPQFMPSSYRSYAVDFNRDGRRDLSGSAADAIGSVANYLKAYGWEAGQAVVMRARLPDEAEQDLSTYVSTSLKPEWSIEALQSLGLVPAERLLPSAQAALLAIEGEDGREYWLGFDNFYAITRYNRSLHYALAVYQLSREIRSARRVGT